MPRKPRDKLPAPIIVLFFVRLIGAAGNFVFPFLTMLLTIKYGWGESRAGAFMTGISVAGALGLAAGGRFSDRIGRKRTIVSCQLGAAAVLALCAFLGLSPSVPWLIGGASLLISATWPVMNAMVADIAPPAQRKAAYSLLYWGNNIGFSVGPLAAGFLFNRNTALLFGVNALALVLMALLLVFKVRESLPSREELEASKARGGLEAAEKGGALAALARRPILLAFALAMIVLNFVYFQHSFSLPLFLKEVAGEDGPALFGAAMTANGITVVLATAAMTWLFGKVPPLLSIALAAFIYALGFGSLAFLAGAEAGGLVFGAIPAFGWIMGTTVVWTLGEILSATNVNVYIASRSPISHRGRFSSAVYLVGNLGMMACPLLSGAFIEARGARAVWPLAAALGLAGALLMTALHAADRKGGPPPAQTD